MRLGSTFAAFMLCLAMAHCIVAAETTNVAPNVPLKSIGPGLFQLGKVRLDKNKKSVTFPAVLNLSPGLIEYVVVTETGKIHESLVRTDVEPYQIHTAMLLLGAKGAGTNTFPEEADSKLPGDKVQVELSWKDSEGTGQRSPIEDFVYNQQQNAAMSRGPWVYNGSRILEGTFIAQQDGSIVSLIADPDALINNPRPGRENDEIWQVRTNGLPPLNWPMEVTITLER